jgi:hypothetical protein
MRKTVFTKVIVFMLSFALLFTTMSQSVLAASEAQTKEKQAVQLAKEVYEKLSPEAKQYFIDYMEDSSPDLLDFHKKNIDKKYVKPKVKQKAIPTINGIQANAPRAYAAVASANPLSILSTELIALNLPTAVRYTLMAMGGGLAAAGLDGPLPVGDIIAAIVAIGGVAVLAYYWDDISPKWNGIVNAFKKAFSSMASNITKAFTDIALKIEIAYVSSKIPSKLKSGDKVDISKFNQKKPGSGPPTWIGPLAWYIQKDTAGHGGRVWKLFDWAGNRIASLAADGKILGK